MSDYDYKKACDEIAADISMLTYERDIGVSIIQGLLSNQREHFEKVARTYLLTMNKMTVNELPQDEREEFENATANAK